MVGMSEPPNPHARTDPAHFDAMADTILSADDPRAAYRKWVADEAKAAERIERRDLLLRFVDACEDMGPAGGLVFIFGGTMMITGAIIFALVGGAAIIGVLAG